MVNTEKVRKVQVHHRTNAEILQGRQHQRREDSQLSSSLFRFLGNTRDQQLIANTQQQEEATDAEQSNWTHVETQLQDYDGNEIESHDDEDESML